MKQKTIHLARAAMTLLLVMLCSLGNVARAQVFETTYTATKGSAGFASEEGYASLVDGKTSTKWCLTISSSPYIEFHSAQAFVPTGYVLTTGNDNSSYQGRNPKTWVLKGKLNPQDDTWTTLATVTNDNTMEDKNYTPYEFSISNANGQSYQYFRFEVSAIRGNGGVLQLSELQFKGYSDPTDITQASIDISPYFEYNGGANIDFSYIVKNGMGVTIEPINYDAVITKGGIVSSVAEAGEYTLTVTGKGSYSGSKSVTFKVLKKLTGEGTQSNPYLINSTDDWNNFAERVTLGDTYKGKYVRLNADGVTASTIAGSNDNNCFQGIFLGNNKTLTINLTATADGCAPFLYLKNATIQDLTIAGTISTGFKYGASIASYTYGTTNIQNCVSTVAITSTRTTYSHDSHGGFIGVNQDGTLTFTNCTFAGKLLGGYSQQNGGFVGYANSSIVYNDCLFVPSEITMNITSSYTFNCNSNATLNGAYYVRSYGIEQGIGVSAGEQYDFCKKEVTYNTTDYYSTLTPSIGNVNDSYLWTGSEISITPTLSYNNIVLTQGTDYEYSINPATIKEPGLYSITFTGKGIYAGTYTKKFFITYSLSGEGSSDSPYLINNITDWEHFAENVNAGLTYSGKFFELKNNITVTTMVGKDSEKSFRGTFDGGGHTMTLNLTSTEDYCAPFKAVYGATIKNLTIEGSVNSSARYASGLIGRIYNTRSYIQNCISTAVINSTHSGSAYNGGFVGYTYTAEFTNCVFAGKMLGESATYNGGFIGYYYSSYDQHFNNCLFNPSEVTMSATSSKTFSQCPTNSFTNTYFLTQFGEAQGIRLTAAANGVYKSEKVTFQGNDYYAACDITGINEVYLHTGDAIAIAPVVKLGSTTLTANTDYTVVIKNSSDETVAPEDLKDEGNYTLTITGNGNYTGSCTMAFRIVSGEILNGYVFETGTDAEGTYYKIQSAEDFSHLASYVASSNNVTSGKRFKQTANLTITEMIGSSESKSFQGVYDGQNNTLTLAIVATENIVAPFRYVKGATIKNLTIAGTISNSGKLNGGVAGYSYGDVTILNCIVSTSITSGYTGDSSNGGFIAHVQTGNVSFSNCAFTGSLLGASATCFGGFVGCRNNTSNVLTFDNCLFAPVEVTMSTEGSATFNRNKNDNNTYSRCLYLTSYGDIQGTQAVTVAPATGVYKPIVAADAKNYYVICDVTINALYGYTGSAVAVTPVVTFDGEALTLGTDYTVSYKNSSDVDVTAENLIELGSYTLTVAGTGSCGGSKTLNFRIANGEDLDGYFFETATDDEGSYYVILDEADLERLAAYVNSGHKASGKRFKQTTNITLTKEHTAIGINNSIDTRFGGIYDGDNKSISGLVINQPNADYQGLFGSAKGATIKNVVIDNCDITAKRYVGGIAGDATSTAINNCMVSGAIKTAAGRVGYDVGGIAGYAYTIDHCVNTASITGNDNSSSTCYGGICGYNDSKVSNCFNFGVVIGGVKYVGSITGQKSGSLTNNYYITGLGLTRGVGSNKTNTGNDQPGAEVVAKITAADGVTLTLPAEPIFVRNTENYYKSGTVVTLSCALPDGKVFDHYSVNSGKISNAAIIDGEHTLTGFSEDVVIAGTFADNFIDLTTAGAVIADIDDLTYNGSEQHPAPVVTLNTETLEENNHYTVSYSDGCANAGTYTVTITGVGRYKGSINKTFKINPFDVSGCDITIDNKSYTGDEIKVTPTVKRGSATLVMGEDKDYTFVTNPTTVQAVGDYTLTITGKGNYTGTKDATFNVYAVVPSSFTCSEVTASSATLTWTDARAANWIVELSESSDFSILVESKEVTEKTATFTGLTADVNYYARVKAVYGEVSSNWSSTLIVQPSTKLVVGSGTYTRNDYPFHLYFHYNLTQQIYTPSELGNKAGSILSLDFFRVDNNPCKNSIEIYLVKTTKNSFESGTDWIKVTDADKVFSGSVDFVSNGWTTITLDTPFDYDGTSNLAVIVYDPMVSGDDYGSSRSFRVFNCAANQAIQYLSDSTDPTVEPTVSGSIVTSKNQLRIRFATEKMELADNATDNSTTIAANDRRDADVTLKGRTLYKDGEWNTICLPFNVTLAGSPLEGATAKTLIDATNDGSTITLSFGDAVSELVAGTPYIIKWDAAAENIVEPVFSGVIIDKTDNQISLDGGNVKFIGYYDAFPITSANDDIYYMTVGNVLRHTGVARTLNACRAYFKFADPSAAREFVLDFGDSQTTGILSVDADSKVDNIYDLGGRKMNNNSRLKKGLYIRNGKKTVIK